MFRSLIARDLFIVSRQVAFLLVIPLLYRVIRESGGRMLDGFVLVQFIFFSFLLSMLLARIFIAQERSSKTLWWLRSLPVGDFQWLAAKASTAWLIALVHGACWIGLLFPAWWGVDAFFHLALVSQAVVLFSAIYFWVFLSLGERASSVGFLVMMLVGWAGSNGRGNRALDIWGELSRRLSHNALELLATVALAVLTAFVILLTSKWTERQDTRTLVEP